MDSRETINGKEIVRKYVNNEKVFLYTEEPYKGSQTTMYNNRFADIIKKDVRYLLNTPQEKLNRIPPDMLKKARVFMEKFANNDTFSQQEANYLHYLVQAMKDIGW